MKRIQQLNRTMLDRLMCDRSIGPCHKHWTVIVALICILIVTSVCLADDPLRYRIREEETPGIRFGNLINDYGFRRKYQKQEIQLLEFRFLSDPLIPLAVGLRDGVLRTKGLIDRDVITSCRQKDLCEVSADVTVQPVDFFRIIKIIVEVIDVNDNPPRFSDSSVFLPILESAAVGSTFLLPSATDPDSPQFGIKRYGLLSIYSKFGLQVTPKLDGFLDVRLLLRERLDRETEDEYRMTLVAFDGGSPELTDSVNVTVRVLDSNDNDPVFDRQNYDVSVVENTPSNTILAKVRALDVDLGANGRVVYGFTGQTRSLYGHVFDIHNVTGEIFLVGSVDRETLDIYQLIVTAEDLGQDSHPVDVTVAVTIDDVNDNRPEVTVNTLAAVGSDMASVPENAPPGTFVAHVTVFDADSGRNGSVSCTLSDAHFTLVQRPLSHQSETEYQILTTLMLDREMISRFNLSLVCSDGGTPTQRTVRQILVDVADENDNRPTFSQDVYTASLPENNAKGVTVVQVNASDADAAENARLRYSIFTGSSPVSAAAASFEIDGHGLVTARQVLDRESTGTYSFYVLATDGGLPSKTGSALLLITITDINDDSPTFTRHSYAFNVAENEAAGQVVGQVSAVDRDLAPYNIFIYSLLQAGSEEEEEEEESTGHCFTIDPQNGTILTLRTLNREDQPVYHLSVVAVDSGSPALSGTASVVIYVDDINDNDPVLEFPSKTNNTVHISNRVPLGFALATVVARDSDADNNGKIGYRLQQQRVAGEEEEDGAGGGGRGFFNVDPILGTVYVSRTLSHFSFQAFHLTVVASDEGFPVRWTTGAMVVVVNQTIPFVDSSSSSVAGEFFLQPVVMTIAGIIGSISLLLIICLVVMVMLVMRRRRGRGRGKCPRHQHSLVKVDCRGERLGGGGGGGGVSEELKMLGTKGAQVVCSSSPEGTPVKTPIVFASTNAISSNHHISRHTSFLDAKPAKAGVAASTEEKGGQRQRKIWIPINKIVDRELDKDSLQSTEGSCADSGRGYSEEGGDVTHRRDQLYCTIRHHHPVTSSSSAVTSSSSSYFWPQLNRSSSSSGAAPGGGGGGPAGGGEPSSYNVHLAPTLLRPSPHQSLTLPRHNHPTGSLSSSSSTCATHPPPPPPPHHPHILPTDPTASDHASRNQTYVARQPNGNRYHGDAVGKSSSFHIRQQHLQPQQLIPYQQRQQQQHRVLNGADHLSYVVSGCSTVIV